MVSSTRKVVAAGVVAVAVCCVALLASTSKSVVLRQQTLDGNYKSASEAQSDLASYFDKQATHFKVAPGMSATAALRQANSIFDNKEKATLRSGRSGSGSTQRKEVTQDLAFSSKDSKNDIDDYFDNLGGGQSHHAHKSTGSSAKYINSKRAAMDDGDNFASINADGSRSQMKDKWSSAAAAKEMDRLNPPPPPERRGVASAVTLSRDLFSCTAGPCSPGDAFTLTRLKKNRHTPYGSGFQNHSLHALQNGEGGQNSCRWRGVRASLLTCL